MSGLSSKELKLQLSNIHTLRIKFIISYNNNNNNVIQIRIIFDTCN